MINFLKWLFSFLMEDIKPVKKVKKAHKKVDKKRRK